MPTPEQNEELIKMGVNLAANMRGSLGHRWTLLVLLSAMTNVIAAILKNEKLTHEELFSRIDNAVVTWKLAYAPMPAPSAEVTAKAKGAKIKSTKVH